MQFFTTLFECADCGSLLEVDQDSKMLLPCNECDSICSKPITDMQETMTLKVRKVGKSGDPCLQIKIKDELYKETKEWRQIKMVIDKTNDGYEKTVIKPTTDQVLYYCKEPLSEHTGRGSAKKKHGR
jgi:hypothetical protein